ncbi:MAG: N-acetylmuramoyl-L-alanine amidase [Verrucomicrobiota bacterium]
MPMQSRGWFILALSATALASCTTVPPGEKNTSRTFTTVVVDAGHGGKDSGAFRRYGPPEKLATLDVATRLSHKLRESEIKTVMTRADDTFIPLDTRVEMENNVRNSVFVSIHFNDSRRAGVKGFETYYHSSVALDLAQRIQGKLGTIPGAVNRGVHTANFRVLRKARYPAVLVECGYLSNRSEGRGARTAGYRELLADKIAEAIVEQRYGAGVYRARNVPNVAQTPMPSPPPPGEGPLAAPLPSSDRPGAPPRH